MGDDALESELDQVTTELAAARIEYASLGARIAGLQARHAALSKAVSGAGQQSRPSGSAAPGYRTDAIVAIMDTAGTEMSINDVLAALRQAGRGHETYDNVGVDLAYLAERGRVTRVRRGIYASASG
ncbi:MAG TPA: hypothetical protein VKH61_22345 [Streptosporangiaceae bacterium]|jgi:hypothetical protein|nr:hypothetical protein [Streptosporangiaceae bacterium]